MGNKNSLAVAVMRACPLHLGHQAIVDKMLMEHGKDRAVVLLGSNNRPPSFRYMFTYQERHGLVRMKYPDLAVAGVPDFPGDDEQWIYNLDTTLQLKGGSAGSAVFYGGCKEDVEWFAERGLTTHILNRFTGEESPPISATEVRDALLEGRSLEGLIDPVLMDPVREIFSKALVRLKKL